MFRKIIAKYLLGGLFLLFVLSDFISKAGMHYNNPLIHTSQIVKGLFEFLAVVYIIKNVSFKDRFLYIGVVLLIFFHSVGLIFLNTDFDYWINLKSNFYIINWYLFIFLLYLAYRSFTRQPSFNLETSYLFLKQCFTGYFYVNLIAALAGFFVGYQLFSAYQIDTRFGFNGLIRNVTHASYIIIIYIIYFYYQYKETPSKTNLYHLLFSVLFVFLLATKATLLFLALFVAFLVFQKSKKLFGLTLLAFVFAPFLLKDYLLNDLLPNHFGVLSKVYQKDGLIAMLTSLRSEQFKGLFIPYVTEKWTVLNYFFGGFDNSLRKIEFEIIDLLLTFGCIGTILYLLLFFKYIFPFHLIKSRFLIVFLFTVVFLAGSFFSSVPVMTVFFVFYILSLKRF